MLYYFPEMESIEELNRLPDTFIIIGSLDLFANECLDYSNKLIQTGITKEFFCVSGIVHVYNILLTKSPQTSRFIELSDNVVEKMFNNK